MERDGLIERYLTHVRVEKRLAARTVELYALDLEKLQTYAEQAGTALCAVASHQVRRWVMHMHSGGRSGRGSRTWCRGWRTCGGASGGGRSGGPPLPCAHACRPQD